MDVPGHVWDSKRRSFIRRVLQGLGVTALWVTGGRSVRALTAPASSGAADAPTRAAAAGATPSGRTFLDALVGRSFRGCRVERVATDHFGGAAIVLSSPERRFQIDLLARGETSGVAETAHYALFLANRGNGSHPTIEREGLALMDVADWLREQEPREERLTTLSLEGRHAAHPRGNFLLH